MDQETKLTIQRTKSFASILRSYKIVLDGKEIGWIDAGRSFSATITPGSHQIVLKIDWCRSNFLDFAAEQGCEVQLKCGTNIEGWKGLLVLIYITFLRDRYLWIRTQA